MRTPTVLMYHGFGFRTAEQDPKDLFVDLGRFDRQLRYLATACRPLDLSGFLTAIVRGSWSPRSVLVTIDDGFASTWQAAELMARHRVPGVVYVPAARVGLTSAWSTTTPDEPILSADQLRALPGLGVEVGVHGMDHVSVRGLDASELTSNIVDAREVLADVTGRRARSFAYPYGDVDDRAAECVRDAGYDVGMSVTTGDDRWRVRRRGVCRVDSTATLALKASPALGPVSRAVIAARRGAVRATSGRL